MSGSETWRCSSPPPVPCEFVLVGGSEGDCEGDVREVYAGEFAEAFGLGPTGAALVRPDGIIAARWRAAPADAAGALERALRAVSHAV